VEEHIVTDHAAAVVGGAAVPTAAETNEEIDAPELPKPYVFQSQGHQMKRRSEERPVDL
jgi:hypothetical protein